MIANDETGPYFLSTMHIFTMCEKINKVPINSCYIYEIDAFVF